MDVHESEAKKKISLKVEEEDVDSGDEKKKTLKGLDSTGTSGSLLEPPSISLPTPSSYSRGTTTVGKGDVDQAIRSIRDGQRRTRQPSTRPLSKIFLDGASSNSPGMMRP